MNATIHTIRVTEELASMIDDVIDFWFAGDVANRSSYMSLIFKHSGPEFFEVKDLREAFKNEQNPMVANHFPYNQLRDNFFSLPKKDVVSFEIVDEEEADFI